MASNDELDALASQALALLQTRAERDDWLERYGRRHGQEAMGIMRERMVRLYRQAHSSKSG